MTKRERVITAIQGGEADYVSTGFSLHFPYPINIISITTTDIITRLINSQYFFS